MELEGSIFAMMVGFKLAVFISVFVMAFLVDAVSGSKSRHIGGLILMAFALVSVAVIEFIHILANLHVGILSLLSENQILKLITNPLLFIAGIGMIWFLTGVNKNIDDYT